MPVATPNLRPPQQSRSRRTLNRILQAALRLVEEKGQEGLTVQEVVRRSGTSVGSFYHRFGSKQDLVRYVEERVWEEAEGVWDEALQEAVAAAPEEDLLTRTVSALVETYLEDFRIRFALAPRRTTSEADDARRLAFRERVRRDLRAALEASAVQPAARGGRAVEVAFALLVGGLRELAGSPDDSDDGGLAPGDLARELTGALRGYVVPDARQPSAAGKAVPATDADVDPFDIWS